MEGEKETPTESMPGPVAQEREEKPEEISKTTREKITGLIADRFLPEIIKRGIESGLEAVLSPDSGLKRVLPDLKIRKEFAEYLLKQIDETKNLTLRVVASEVRSFLENTNMEEAIRRVLTSLAFEVKTEIRFRPAEGGGLRPTVKSDITKLEPKQKKSATAGRSRRSRRP
jgi:hypothetical protein